MQMLLDTVVDEEILQSPLNYTGGKYKLLSSILPIFPKNISTFVDLFCGGANVGINAKSKNVILNDNNRNLINLFNVFKETDEKVFFNTIYDIIQNYNLSESSKYGYEFYQCDSNKGLSEYNKNKFLKLRKDFNNMSEKNYYYYAVLYVLILYSFNNQIRFNKQGHFNLPVGKRDFNEKMENKLIKFIKKLKSKKYELRNSDFRDLDLSQLDNNSFIYADPPYLIACATYNEQGGWGENDEEDLLNFLDNLNKQNIKFALSNVIRNKDKKNHILTDWINSNGNKYKVINLNYNYNNSNYQIKNKNSTTEEILVINY